MWYVYILKGGKGRLYTGMTQNKDRRLFEHQTGHGGAYTYKKGPFELLLTEGFDDKISAETRERQIKGWSQAKKLALIHGDIARLKTLSRSKD
jgi:putative endonuclease